MEKYKFNNLRYVYIPFHSTSFIVRYFCINFCLTYQFFLYKIRYTNKYKFKENSFFFHILQARDCKQRDIQIILSPVWRSKYSQK